MAYTYRDGLDDLFNNLRARSDANRQLAAARFGEQVNSAFRELPTVEFSRYYSDVQNRMTNLIVNGADTHERTGGLYLLNALIDFKGGGGPPCMHVRTSPMQPRGPVLYGYPSSQAKSYDSFMPSGRPSAGWQRQWQLAERYRPP